MRGGITSGPKKEGGEVMTNEARGGEKKEAASTPVGDFGGW